ncbi:unnamed protein product [Brassicogethes aeneus]|uniref:Uncharacterized protein n=1 Tax=Brassicogethes aeneus TaxID=1431903 RepID=A0A9P0ATZ7_BRAAE|nr:unnamed protein product [Brassicogethes aeneus]
MAYHAPVVNPTIGCWISSTNASIPAGAFSGGRNVYVIRAYQNGGWLPGKFVTGHHDAYVAWGGKEIPCCQFEVLCNSRMRWQHCRGSGIPPNAFVAGSTENGEPLYVGKTVHNEEVCIGKVQRSHGALYFPWGGKELTTPTFEILVK